MFDLVLARLASALIESVARRSLSVLVFHHVLPEPDPLFPGEMHARRFDRLLAFLAKDCRIMPLGRALWLLRARMLPRGTLSITFDDGYADNATVALPILRAHGIAATFFVASGFLEGGRMWNDTLIEAVRRAPGEALDLAPLGLGAFELADIEARRQAVERLISHLKYLPLRERSRQVEHIAERSGASLPGDLMMNPAQVRALHEAGMEVGAHTVNHPILARLDAHEAREEIHGSKRQLEDILGERVSLFAYPNGKPGRDYLPEHVSLVRKAGFRAAVSTAGGVFCKGSDLFQVPRFTPWQEGHAAFRLALARNRLRARHPLPG
ncbi:MAG: polysaccharide deacetylase family protein [Zoogloea sp.]|nr:polysaccharide deacetylase family protein [Zoogloea sp.]